MSRRTWIILGLALLLVAGTIAFTWWQGQISATGCPDPCAEILEPSPARDAIWMIGLLILAVIVVIWVAKVLRRRR